MIFSIFLQGQKVCVTGEQCKETSQNQTLTLRLKLSKQPCLCHWTSLNPNLHTSIIQNIYHIILYNIPTSSEPVLDSCHPWTCIPTSHNRSHWVDSGLLHRRYWKLWMRRLLGTQQQFHPQGQCQARASEFNSKCTLMHIVMSRKNGDKGVKQKM